MPEVVTLRRVLIVADESADWMVVGLRQLDRLALTVNEFALENREAAPVLVCVFWRPDVEPSQRRVPKHGRFTDVTFTTEVDGRPYDLVLSTRLFLYRRAVSQLFSEGRASARPMTSEDAFSENGDVQKHVPPSDEKLWETYSHQAKSLPQSREGAWEYIADGNQIDAIETRFLRSSGKSQDGPVSAYLNRPISRAVTRLLLRSPITPNGWTLLIFPIPIVAALVLAQGTYGSFVFGMILFQVFSVLDGCDGEIARAKFMESEKGRRLDEVFDILSNVLLVIGLGFGLSARATSAGQSGWIWAMEGIVAALLIGLNEFYLTARNSTANSQESEALGGTLYPRHRDLVERSGMLRLGTGFTHWVMQLTKHDVAVLGFLLLAIIGWPALILHLMFAVTAITLMLAVRSRGAS